MSSVLIFVSNFNLSFYECSARSIHYFEDAKLGHMSLSANLNALYFCIEMDKRDVQSTDFVRLFLQK